MKVNQIKDMTKWISVKDKLPEKDDWYLCYSPQWKKYHVYRFCSWCYGDRKRFWNSGGSETTKITHWMYLPPTPEDN